MTTKPKVMLVEDSPEAMYLLKAVLSGRCELVPASNLTEAMQRASEEFPSVIVLDLSLPEVRGLDTIKLMHAACPTIPIVVYTGYEQERQQVIDAGAKDYMRKCEVTAVQIWAAIEAQLSAKAIHEEAQHAIAGLKEAIKKQSGIRPAEGG